MKKQGSVAIAVLPIQLPLPDDWFDVVREQVCGQLAEHQETDPDP